jgi:DNA-binding LacI/PurR family transcriptional regulator
MQTWHQQLEGGVRVTRLPFRIERKDGAKLTDQVTDGLRHAIRSGVFRAGDSLPTCKKMAIQAGVSEIIIRHAVKRLADEGIVRVRTRTGVTISNLRGQVLYLTWAPPNMYYQSVLRGVVTERLHASNVLLNATYISRDEAQKDYPQVRTDLTHAISLAVVEGIANGLDVLLAPKGIPFIHFTSLDPSPLAARAILLRHTAVFPEIRDHCLACGARAVLLVRLSPSDERNEQLGKVLADAGMTCRTLDVERIVGLESPESVIRGALDAMGSWLKQNERLPDLIWFNDDFVAQGALTAMANRGIRIPDDVQVITWANRGLGPVFMKPLTRVEMDPIQHGEALAACVLSELEGKRSDKRPIILSPVFIEGATTVKKARVAEETKTRRHA